MQSDWSRPDAEENMESDQDPLIWCSQPSTKLLQLRVTFLAVSIVHYVDHFSYIFADTSDEDVYFNGWISAIIIWNILVSRTTHYLMISLNKYIVCFKFNINKYFFYNIAYSHCNNFNPDLTLTYFFRVWSNSIAFNSLI